MTTIRVQTLETSWFAYPERSETYSDMEATARHTDEVTPPAIHTQELTHFLALRFDYYFTVYDIPEFKAQKVLSVNYCFLLLQTLFRRYRILMSLFAFG